MTTRELARIAGVSQSTVSRSLSDKPGISRETAERIRNLAKQHGYIIHNGRRKQTAAKEKRAIAILSTDNGNDDMYLNSLFNHLFNNISAENYLSFFETDKPGRLVLDCVKDLLETGMMDGFLIIRRAYDAELESYLNRLHVPHVYIHYFSIHSLEHVNIVDGDHYIGAYTATRHLIELNHKKIFTITSPGREFNDRSNGFLAAMHDHGLPVDPKRDIIQCNHTYESAYTLARQELERMRGYTALFAQTDEMAIGCMNGLQDGGLRLPQQMSVVGFDGIEPGRYCRPALTTVRLRCEEVARASVERIIRLIDGAKSSQDNSDQNVRSFIQPSLVRRDSAILLDE